MDNSEMTNQDRVLPIDNLSELDPFAAVERIKEKAFYDLYGQLEEMCNPKSHMEISGRRGTGKTALMAKAYLYLWNQYEKNKQHAGNIFSIYIDLNDISARRDLYPEERAEYLFREILKRLLKAPEHYKYRYSRRIWGLEDFVDSKPNWVRRNFIRWRLRSFRKYINSRGEWIYRYLPVEEQVSTATRIGAHGVSGSPTANQLQAEISRQRSLTHSSSGYYRLLPKAILELLEGVLSAMNVKHLIIFLDEWSGNSIGRETQPYLYDLLMATFQNSEKVALKIATVPGSRNIKAPARVTRISLDSTAGQIKPDYFRDGLIRILIGNLQEWIGDFPNEKYDSPTELENHFPAFKKDVFEADGFEEFIRASENLPRQMIFIFKSACKLRREYTPDMKLSAAIIRWAAKKYYSEMIDPEYQNRPHPVINLIEQFLRSGKKVVDVERFQDSLQYLNWLVDEGIIRKCDYSPPENYSRYLLSYPLEVYRLYRNSYSGEWDELVLYEKLVVEHVSTCRNYPNTPRIELSKLPKELFQSKEI